MKHFLISASKDVPTLKKLIATILDHIEEDLKVTNHHNWPEKANEYHSELKERYADARFEQKYF